MKKPPKYVLWLVAAIGLLIYIEYITPAPVDWAITLYHKHKAPYGTYVLHQRIRDIFPQATTALSSQSFQDMLRDNDLPEETTAILTVAESFNADSLEVNALLNLVEAGNTVLISANYFSGYLKDTLHFEAEDLTWRFIQIDDLRQTDSLYLHSVADSATRYYYRKDVAFSHFSSYDTLRTEVLALNQHKYPVLMQMPIGKGKLILSSTPLALSNYYLLKGPNQAYAAGMLSYLPPSPLLWTEYHQVGRVEPATPLRYILSNPSLRWAYLVAIIGLLLFILFEAKRKQRIIPVVVPPANETVQFAKTVGILYYQQGDHKSMALKKILYFMEIVRSRYHIDTQQSPEELAPLLAAKSGVQEGKTLALLKMMAAIRVADTIAEGTLFMLNKKIEDFYKQTQPMPA
jgi:hypothetical protein